jgi:catechol 2,3-dioxygenase-like lactoylglutathione lyase family enzyme
MIVNGAHHTGFSVVDLAESIEFYSMLGCELLWQREITDQYFGAIVGVANCRARVAHLRVPGSAHVIELLEYIPHRSAANLVPNEPGHPHVCFTVGDLLSVYAKLKAQSVRFLSEPVLITAGVNIGGYAVYMVDPSGITLELLQPPE